ncbi:MAG: DNA repair protein [Proteobacteria bacterium]|nr:DNA repair protein [Pseudomonadota bacterium]
MTQTTIVIARPEIFSFSACLNFLNRGYAECLYQANDLHVTRLIRLTTGLVIIQVSADKHNIKIITNQPKLSHQSISEISHYVTDWFDLTRDLSGFYQLLASKTATKEFPQSYYGLRLMGIVDLFEALCWCVIGQQINLTFAHKMKTRLVHKYGEKIQYQGQTYYCFPTPEVLLTVAREDLVAMQFSKQKINYIYNIAQVFCDDNLNKNDLLQVDKVTQMEQLLSIKGIGPWTANYVCMKSLRDMTCIAYGDTGLSLALHRVFNTQRKPDKSTVDKFFQPFAGWESYLNFYLWKSL